MQLVGNTPFGFFFCLDHFEKCPLYKYNMQLIAFPTRPHYNPPLPSHTHTYQHRGHFQSGTRLSKGWTEH